MGRGLRAWVACAWLVGLVGLGGCTALSGLDKDYQEVDCFPPGTCDASVDGPGADSAPGDATMADTSTDRAMSDAMPGVDGPSSNMDAEGGSSGQDSGGSDAGDAGDGGGCSGADLACDAGCVANDIHNCGTCGNDCTALPHVSGTVSCTAGACSFPLSSCAPGWTHCSGSPSQGCETDITASPNCGACGVSCMGTTPVCSGSGSSYACTSGCSGTSTNCSGTCVDTTSNPQDCKTCGDVCTTTVAHAQPTCVSSACSFTCNSGYSPCSGACVDEQNDNNNCNGCGLQCTGGTTCVSGSCQCPAGSYLCGSSCVANDPNACGPTCAVCPATSGGTATCSVATCGFSCNPGYVGCNGGCADEETDPDNCGGCGPTYACSSGASCIGGACQCPGGEMSCGGVCASCSTPANAMPTCSGTACTYTCESGYTACAGGCWDTGSDPNHCGATCAACDSPPECQESPGSCSNGNCQYVSEGDGTPCGTNAQCSGGSCGCESGYSSCPSGCTNVASDNNNCGTCGHVCPALAPPSQGTTCSGDFCSGFVGGYETVAGSSPTVLDGTLYACQIVLTEGVTAQSLNVEVTGGSGSTVDVVMSLYSDSSNLPGALYQQGSEAILSPVVGLVTVNMTVTVPAGTYWIAMTGNFGTSANVKNETGISCVASAARAFNATMPATFPASSSYSSMAFYMVAKGF